MSSRAARLQTAARGGASLSLAVKVRCVIAAAKFTGLSRSYLVQLSNGQRVPSKETVKGVGEICMARSVDRDGEAMRGQWESWWCEEETYIREHQPVEFADTVISGI